MFFSIASTREKTKDTLTDTDYKSRDLSTPMMMGGFCVIMIGTLVLFWPNLSKTPTAVTSSGYTSKSMLEGRIARSWDAKNIPRALALQAEYDKLRQLEGYIPTEYITTWGDVYRKN